MLITDGQSEQCMFDDRGFPRLFIATCTVRGKATDDRDQIKNWLEDNCTGMYFLSWISTDIWFEQREDAALFVLRFR